MHVRIDQPRGARGNETGNPIPISIFPVIPVIPVVDPVHSILSSNHRIRGIYHGAGGFLSIAVRSNFFYLRQVFRERIVEKLKREAKRARRAKKAKKSIFAFFALLALFASFPTLPARAVIFLASCRIS